MSMILAADAVGATAAKPRPAWRKSTPNKCATSVLHIKSEFKNQPVRSQILDKIIITFISYDSAWQFSPAMLIFWRSLNVKAMNF